MIAAEMRNKINDYLFAFPNSQVIAIIDGASVSELQGAIEINKPKHCCLLSGKMDVDLANAAPYLIKLEKTSPFTEWLLKGWGKHFGIYCIINRQVSFDELRTHFRGLLTVKTHDGHTVYFRFYDPRVLNIYLPTCTGSEAQQVFGPVTHYILERGEENTVQQYTPGLDGVEHHAFRYSAA